MARRRPWRAEAVQKPGARFQDREAARGLKVRCSSSGGRTTAVDQVHCINHRASSGSGSWRWRERVIYASRDDHTVDTGFRESLSFGRDRSRVRFLSRRKPATSHAQGSRTTRQSPAYSSKLTHGRSQENRRCRPQRHPVPPPQLPDHLFKCCNHLRMTGHSTASGASSNSALISGKNVRCRRISANTVR
ncbi:hypothetical protein Rleg9DRAFT_0489 [Rhizobium leguminosarum bv. trifolii WSM597]|uniref:Uncharacterized protein n=1 Tax=Rhizobium leguminosarum bv. trifolii WSM597 TaxID=754764 RepID=I9N1H7_RHILT|nr:hypothetical protein Rleg9DRAFT_0489 [Rhizobium leguminosarum bv. trifolii WSM597]